VLNYFKLCTNHVAVVDNPWFWWIVLWMNWL